MNKAETGAGVTSRSPYDLRKSMLALVRWNLQDVLTRKERAVAKSKREEVETPYECGEGAHRVEQASGLCDEFSNDRLKGRDAEWFHENLLAAETQVRENVTAQAVQYVIRELLSVEFLELIQLVEERDDDDELQEAYSTWRSTTKSKDALKAAEAQAEREAAAV